MEGGDKGWWIGKLVEKLDVVRNSQAVGSSASTGDLLVHDYKGDSVDSKFMPCYIDKNTRCTKPLHRIVWAESCTVCLDVGPIQF